MAGQYIHDISSGDGLLYLKLLKDIGGATPAREVEFHRDGMIRVFQEMQQKTSTHRQPLLRGRQLILCP